MHKEPGRGDGISVEPARAVDTTTRVLAIIALFGVAMITVSGGSQYHTRSPTGRAIACLP